MNISVLLTDGKRDDYDTSAEYSAVGVTFEGAFVVVRYTLDGDSGVHAYPARRVFEVECY